MLQRRRRRQPRLLRKVAVISTPDVGADASSAQPSKARLLEPRHNLNDLSRDFSIVYC